jgi:hypothetical protein
MSFLRKNFGPIGGQSRKGIGGAPAMWSYKTDDVHAVVDGAGYFNEVRNLLSIGDIIYVVVVTNLNAATEALSTYGSHCVIDKSSSAVDVTNVTVGTVTDSD